MLTLPIRRVRLSVVAAVLVVSGLSSLSPLQALPSPPMCEELRVVDGGISHITPTGSHVLFTTGSSYDTRVWVRQLLPSPQAPALVHGPTSATYPLLGLSDDGRFVLAGTTDFQLHDAVNGAVVSVGYGWDAILSSDGRFVTYSAQSTDPISNSNRMDVVRFDRTTATTTRLTPNPIARFVAVDSTAQKIAYIEAAATSTLVVRDVAAATTASYPGAGDVTSGVIRGNELITGATNSHSPSDTDTSESVYAFDLTTQAWQFLMRGALQHVSRNGRYVSGGSLLDRTDAAYYDLPYFRVPVTDSGYLAIGNTIESPDTPRATPSYDNIAYRSGRGSITVRGNNLASASFDFGPGISITGRRTVPEGQEFDVVVAANATLGRRHLTITGRLGCVKTIDGVDVQSVDLMRPRVVHPGVSQLMRVGDLARRYAFEFPPSPGLVDTGESPAGQDRWVYVPRDAPYGPTDYSYRPLYEAPSWVVDFPQSLLIRPSRGEYRALQTPRRLIDTRGGFALGLNESRQVKIRHPEFPIGGASAVVLNVTAVNTRGGGYITIWPTGQARPTASNLNFIEGQTIPNLVTVRLGAEDAIDVFNASPQVDLLIDIVGWYASDSLQVAGSLPGSTYLPITPTRVFDSRFDLADDITSDSALTLRLFSASSPVRGVVMNVTAADATAPGFLAVAGNVQSLREISNINYRTGIPTPNMVISRVEGDGTPIYVYNYGGTVNVIIDVVGLFVGPNDISVRSHFTSVAPYRALDTRTGLGAAARPIQRNSVVDLDVRGAGVPADATAVLLNVTATRPTSLGYLTVYPSGVDRPTASSLNFVPGQTVPNLVAVAIGRNGRISFFNEEGTTDVIADIAGWYAPPPGMPPSAPLGAAWLAKFAEEEPALMPRFSTLAA